MDTLRKAVIVVAVAVGVALVAGYENVPEQNPAGSVIRDGSSPPSQQTGDPDHRGLKAGLVVRELR